MTVQRLDPQSLEYCRGKVKADLELQMGITDLLEGKPNKKCLEEIEKARVALAPVIEEQAKILYRWLHR